MANWFIGLNRGKLQNPQSIVAGILTGGTDVEVRIDTGKGTTKEDVYLALCTINQFILGNGVGTTTGPGADQPPL